MKPTSRFSINFASGGNLAFLIVVVASYISAATALTYSQRSLPAWEVVVLVGAGLVLAGCEGRKTAESGGQIKSEPPVKSDENAEGGEVTATEDLMREHGVLRRALLVFIETAPKLRSNASAVAPDALQRTAKLFRAFGEDYHEKKLEEAYIFPAVKRAGGPTAARITATASGTTRRACRNSGTS